MPVESEQATVDDYGPGRQRMMLTCLVAIAVCVVGAVLVTLKSIVTPLLIAILLFFLLNPIVAALTRRVPAWVAWLAIMLTVVLAMYLFGRMLQVNGQAFVEKLPQYTRRAETALDTYARYAGMANEEGGFDWERHTLKDLFHVSEQQVLEHAIGTTMEFVEAALMVTFYLIFILIDAHKLPGRIARSLDRGGAGRVIKIGQQINRDIWRYLVVKTLVSLGLGVSTGAICWWFQLDFWPLWGLVMFLANYITYIGSIAALLPPIAIACLQFSSLWSAALLTGLLVVNRLVWIDYVEIHYSGKHLNVSPLLLLLSIALMGWMWGVVGMLLAVPLVTSIRIALDGFDSTRYMASLISGD